MHYDAISNFFTQLCGRKRVLLFPPSAWPLLYPFPTGHPKESYAMVDIEAVRPPFSCPSHALLSPSPPFPAFACPSQPFSSQPDPQQPDLAFLPLPHPSLTSHALL